MVTRCDWATTGPMIEYHDQQWGVPVRDDRTLFEMLVLEGAQAGLSWETVLRKREGYRTAFDDFDPRAIAEYGQGRVDQLLLDPGIVRNRRKVESCVQNARQFLKVQEEWGSFSEYLWEFVGGQPVVNLWTRMEQVPANTNLSDRLSKDLRRRGFKFVGPTICYAYLQSTGLVNDHLVSCFRYEQIAGMPAHRETIPDINPETS